jgi:hypothetical protein
MTSAFYLLLVIGHLGAFDVVYFHIYKCKLNQRPECQVEVIWHTARHLIYALQFLCIANLRFHGWALLLLAAIYVADVFIAWSDVWEETASRRNQNGLPRAEYMMHIMLTFMVGCYILLVGQNVWPDRLLPAAVIVDPPHVPFALRLYMSGMGMGALGMFVHDSIGWWRFRRAHRNSPVMEAKA